MKAPTWFTWPGSEPTGLVAAIVPGDGYSAVEPILYWIASGLVQAGFAVDALVWPDETQRDSDRRRLVRSGLDALSSTTRAPDLIVAMSSGCVAAEIDPDVPLIALSPVTRPDTPATLDGRLTRSGRTLAITGTLDDLGSPAQLAGMGFQVVEIEGANHALEVPGDWTRSMSVASEVVGLSLDCAGDLRSER